MKQETDFEIPDSLTLKNISNQVTKWHWVHWVYLKAVANISGTVIILTGIDYHHQLCKDSILTTFLTRSDEWWSFVGRKIGFFSHLISIYQVNTCSVCFPSKCINTLPWEGPGAALQFIDVLMFDISLWITNSLSPVRNTESRHLALIELR